MYYEASSEEKRKSCEYSEKVGEEILYGYPLSFSLFPHDPQKPLKSFFFLSKNEEEVNITDSRH